MNAVSNSHDPILAAGVVLTRPGRRGPQIAVVHRPHRADWSLPKGKVDPGEHVLHAAVRECDEETGIVPTLGPPLTTQHYQALGQDKLVFYWRAEVNAEEGFAPDEEVDEVRWVHLPEARSLLTYPRDVDLVQEAMDLPLSTPLIVLRHTKALKRADFDGNADNQRPLSGKGRSQAKSLVPLLSAYGIRDLYSSDAVRCQESLRRYAQAISATINIEPALSEEGHEQHPKRAARRLMDLMNERRPSVVCTHRPVLPTLMSDIGTLAGADTGTLDPKLAPGEFVVLHRHFVGDDRPRLIAIERHSL